MVYGEVKSFREKVPLTILSGGMNKLAAILLSFPTAPNCVVLIDEIEGGFYYRRFPKILETLVDFCNTYNSQIFATTHSGECIAAAAEVARNNPGAFSVIQASSGTLHQFPGDTFVDAVDENIEIR